MLTYNSSAFSRETWTAFLAFVKRPGAPFKGEGPVQRAVKLEVEPAFIGAALCYVPGRHD